MESYQPQFANPEAMPQSQMPSVAESSMETSLQTTQQEIASLEQNQEVPASLQNQEEGLPSELTQESLSEMSEEALAEKQEQLQQEKREKEEALEELKEQRKHYKKFLTAISEYQVFLQEEGETNPKMIQKKIMEMILKGNLLGLLSTVLKTQIQEHFEKFQFVDFKLVEEEFETLPSVESFQEEIAQIDQHQEMVSSQMEMFEMPNIEVDTNMELGPDIEDLDIPLGPVDQEGEPSLEAIEQTSSAMENVGEVADGVANLAESAGSVAEGVGNLADAA
ncbi:hypothetical protein KC929_03010 [Patescibacteria group bacterium]|nr:hypothetical protein [Patescibacteria group bacterium]